MLFPDSHSNGRYVLCSRTSMPGLGRGECSFVLRPDGMLRLIGDLALASPAKSAARARFGSLSGGNMLPTPPRALPNKRVGPPSPFHILPPSRVCLGSPEARKPGSPEPRPATAADDARSRHEMGPLLQICFGPGSGRVKIATRLARSRRPPIPHNQTIHWSKGLARTTPFYCMSCHGRIGHPHGHHPQSHPLHPESGLLIGCSAPKRDSKSNFLPVAAPCIGVQGLARLALPNWLPCTHVGQEMCSSL
jgi:hypothetical protein